MSAAVWRFCVLFALVVGVFLLQGAPCDSVAAVSEQCHVTVTSVDVATDAPPDLGGVLELCLLVLLVMVASAGLRDPDFVPLRRVRPLGVPPRPAPPLPPAMDQLCVLRV
ncbi:hypothetical protein ACQEU1_39740 [Lentzea sp. CA-135723]